MQEARAVKEKADRFKKLAGGNKFGEIVSAADRKAAEDEKKRREEEERKAREKAAKTSEPKLDSRVADMMKSE